eukprot:TRINITY_DN90693_c0_g1_i1.p1 TRINITY_DN90693_c0_g1~~TRINITY_DN90693_c0_g1_i1.p1  ORF type:complete len:375 (+),score=143.63 TRINITY_DN90693_c0_g1_i1:59-1126(+)
MGGPAPAEAQEEDDNFSEQVMVAALPDTIPEVHVATLRPAEGLLVLRTAAVAGVGEVMLGNETRIDLKKAGSVVTSDGVVAVLGKDSNLMVQMHLETTEEQVAWTKALKLVMSQLQAAAVSEVPSSARGSPKGTAAPASPATQSKKAASAGGTSGADRASPRRTSAPVSPASQQGKKEASAKLEQHPSTSREANNEEEEVALLRAHSQQLQRKIETLEAMSNKRDRHHATLLKRLEDSMQMLEAVQAMCSQQCKVIDVQKVAIAELSAECGVQVEDDNEEEGEEEEEDEEDDAAEEVASAPQTSLSRAEAEMAAKAEQMMALLQQADAMQKALQQLEAMEAAGLLEGQKSSAAPE